MTNGSITSPEDPCPGLESRIKLYTELASWFHLLTAPSDYAEEAAFYWQVISSACLAHPQTILELGSGGGNNASHMKSHCQLTLVDLSPQMLRISQSINPECEHIAGDMRSVRLGRLFDAVFIHDAVSYLLTEQDLGLAIHTAFVHCRPGGVALFAPDFVRETFRCSTAHGGHDGNERSMRYLEWTWDPEPSDSTYVADFAYLFRDLSGRVSAEYDRHELGLFSRYDWLRLVDTAGFEARALPFEHSEAEPGAEVFLGLKPVNGS